MNNLRLFLALLSVSFMAMYGIAAGKDAYGLAGTVQPLISSHPVLLLKPLPLGPLL
jgi:hypothetical protein